MKMTKQKNVLSLILCIVLIVAMAFTISGCNGKKTPDGNAENTAISVTDMGVLGEGANSFTFTVTDTQGDEFTYQINTDKKTVGEALTELNLIDGEQGAYGLYVKTVKGITVDFDKDGKYWAFYVNGNYATSGVDTTDIENGETYSFKAE